MKFIMIKNIKTPLLFLLLVFPILIYGQKISNNNQVKKIPISLDNLKTYFEYFNDANHSNYPLIPALKKTTVDSIVQKERGMTIHLSEYKQYEAAQIVTNRKKYNKAIQEKRNSADILILTQAELKAEMSNHPIKPYLDDSFYKNGLLQWSIEIEALDENNSQLTFIFDSLKEAHRKEFLKKYISEIKDSNYNFTAQEIYILETFKKLILKYITAADETVAFNAIPMR